MFDDEYITFGKLQDAADYLGYNNTTEVKTNHIIIRNQETNQFILFKDHNAYKDFFNSHIKNSPKIYH